MEYQTSWDMMISSDVSPKGLNRLLGLLFVLFTTSLRLFSQESNGWLFVTQAPAYTTWKPNDIIEAEEGGFFVAFWDYHEDSHILKLSEEGELETELEVSACDTTIIISKLFFNRHVFNGYIAIALCRPESGSVDAIMTLQFNENLNVIYRNVVSCVGLSQPVFNLCVLKQDYSFIIAITDIDYSHHLVKLDMMGDILEWKNVEVDSLMHICNVFKVFGETDSHIGMYANVSNVGAKMGVLEFDDSLQLIRRAYFDQWQNEEEFGICVSYLYDAINSMMIPLPDSSGYLISSRLKESLYTPGFTPIKDDRSTIIAKADLNFVKQDNYVIVGHLNDTVEVPSYYKSADCYSDPIRPDVVYQCTMQGFENESGWPMGLTSLGIIITKLDDNINVIWKKRFLCEKELFPFAIAATRDGGCVVAGMAYDYNHERRLDLFVLRISADGTVGLNGIQEENMAYVYPNPTKEIIRIDGMEAKEAWIYNALGQCVGSFKGNEANVEALAEGVYLLRVVDEEGLTHTLRLVVSK